MTVIDIKLNSNLNEDYNEVWVLVSHKYVFAGF